MDKTVTLLSFHLYKQRRRGGMHWLCDAFRAQGWKARFVTCDFSWVTRLKGDRRTEFGETIGINQLTQLDDSLAVGVVHSPYHQLGRQGSWAGRALNLMTRAYPFPMEHVVERFVSGSDLVLMESCGALTYVPIVRRVTGAPIVYRVSDNLRVIRPVPSLLQAEAQALRSVDVVSLASDFLARQFAGAGANICLHPMGLQKDLFNAQVPDPYPADGRKRVVISGSSGLDAVAVTTAARLFPDWHFVLFGSTRSQFSAPNLMLKGEVPFSELVPWVKHAHIGFAPYLQQNGFEYQAEHSNRLLQYTYCGLPSVVPRALCSPSKPQFLGYGQAGEESALRGAFLQAAALPRDRVPTDTVLDWQQVAAAIAADASAARPRMAA